MGPRESVSESAPPGGPPRPGLVWNDSTHRWVRPKKQPGGAGASADAPAPPGGCARVAAVIEGSAKAKAVMAELAPRIAKYHATLADYEAKRNIANQCLDKFDRLDKELAKKGIEYNPGETYTDPDDPRTAVEKYRLEFAKPARLAYKESFEAHQSAAHDVRTQVVLSMGGKGKVAFQTTLDPAGTGWRSSGFQAVEGKDAESVERTFDKATSFVGGVTGGKWEGAPVVLGVSKTGRAFAVQPHVMSGHCEATIGEVPLGQYSEDSNAQTAVHELGHVVEFTKPGVKELANEFLAHRCGDEPLVPLSKAVPKAGYGKDEIGRKDDFAKAFGEDHAYYVGKQYADGSTEVISMGLEKLYADPVKFITADPEYAKFLFHVLSM